MKSEFILAFNEICQSRGLPQEVVFEALKTALVSAYRRNVNASSNQDVTVEIDRHTGEPTIYAEKEVVDSIIDDRTEVALTVARAAGHDDVDLGDMVMIESTPPHFGRIAAQTAKQVILQRVREAEREQLFEDFSAREGEIVNGTVQSISGQHITIGLGRTEAILPRSQQVRGERYRAHDKIRVYVLEVRRTNRGPQIVVSRNHRNLLRRLLELEVPEIYNGQVDIKSIAREAGARSKVAVMALQPGVDPVGACVGMRGVRIQSIVRELNDEKIDVIEWDADQPAFIAKALSPARVSQVYLEDHPIDGKTAIVMVPDDQLSLAIGREGQNARLAAKLTGWRIDIKSLTESAQEALQQLDHPAIDRVVARNKEQIDQVELILVKKETARPITAEDYNLLSRFVANTLGRVLVAHAAELEVERRKRAEARKRIPAEAWEAPLEILELPARIHNILEESKFDNAGEVIYRLEMDPPSLLELPGFGDKSLESVQEAVDAYLAAAAEAAALAAAEAAELAGEEIPAEAAEAEAEALAAAEAVADAPVAESESIEEAAVVVDEITASTEVEAEAETVEEAVAEPEAALAEPGLAEPDVTEAEAETETVEEEAPEPSIDDLSVSLAQPSPKKPKKAKPKPAIVVVAPPKEEEDDEDAASRREKTRKGRQLVFDEEAGEVVAKRKRKGSRRREEWEDFDLEDLDY